jgi:hypothetical protein
MSTPIHPPDFAIHREPAYRCARMVIAELGDTPSPAQARLRRVALRVPRQLIHDATESGRTDGRLEKTLRKLRREIELARQEGELDAERCQRLLQLTEEIAASR